MPKAADMVRDRQIRAVVPVMISPAIAKSSNADGPSSRAAPWMMASMVPATLVSTCMENQRTGVPPAPVRLFRVNPTGTKKNNTAMMELICKGTLPGICHALDSIDLIRKKLIITIAATARARISVRSER